MDEKHSAPEHDSVTPRHYHQFNRPPDRGTDPSQWEDLARQSERHVANINQIMARYEKTGIIPIQNPETFFADVSELGDYRTALHQIREAESVFLNLPAEYRERFDNEVGEFLDFALDPENLNEMVEMGLIEEMPDQVRAEASEATTEGGDPDTEAAVKASD